MMTDSEFETNEDTAADADDATDAAAETEGGTAVETIESLRLERRARKSLRLARRQLEEASAGPEELARQTTAEAQIYALLSLANSIREASKSPDTKID